jgi:hypothetical protein
VASAEHDRAVAVEQYTILAVPVDRSGKGKTFGVPADAYELVGGERDLSLSGGHL